MLVPQLSVWLSATPWTICSSPVSSVHGILQARILEWVAILSSRVSSWPRDGTQVFFIAGRFFTIWATREALKPFCRVALEASLWKYFHISYFQYFYFPTRESTAGFFCSLHCENLVNLEVKLTKVYGPLWSFQFLDFSTEPLAVHQLRLSYPCTGSPGDFF